MAAKAQVHYRLPEKLVSALKSKAESESITITDLVTRLLEQGLGLTSSSLAVDLVEIENYVLQTVSNRIAPLEDRLDSLEQSLKEYAA